MIYFYRELKCLVKLLKIIFTKLCQYILQSYQQDYTIPKQNDFSFFGIFLRTWLLLLGGSGGVNLKILENSSYNYRWHEKCFIIKKRNQIKILLAVQHIITSTEISVHLLNHSDLKTTNALQSYLKMFKTDKVTLNNYVECE